MGRLDRLHALPKIPQPKTLQEWLKLPELPSGEHELFNVGVLGWDLADCRRHGLGDLPPIGELDETDMIPLPNFEVLQEEKPVMYRATVMFGGVARRIYEDAGRAHATGRHLLPKRFRFGRDAHGGAFAIPI